MLNELLYGSLQSLSAQKVASLLGNNESTIRKELETYPDHLVDIIIENIPKLNGFTFEKMDGHVDVTLSDDFPIHSFALDGNFRPTIPQNARGKLLSIEEKFNVDDLKRTKLLVSRT